VIPVIETSGSGTLLHTAIAGDGGYDEIFLWAANVTDTDVTLTINWGGAGAVGDALVLGVVIPAHSPATIIAEGQRLNGGLVVGAIASVANAINISGYVNRIN
jgi:hypothetical protein